MSDGTIHRMRRTHRTLLAHLPLLVLCFLGILLNAQMRHAGETRRSESQVTERSQPLAGATLQRPVDALTVENMVAIMGTTAPRPEAGDIMANAWLLVLKNYTSPKQYISNSDPVGPTVQPAPKPTTQTLDSLFTPPPGILPNAIDETRFSFPVESPWRLDPHPSRHPWWRDP